MVLSGGSTTRHAERRFSRIKKNEEGRLETIPARADKHFLNSARPLVFVLRRLNLQARMPGEPGGSATGEGRMPAIRGAKLSKNGCAMVLRA